MTSLAATLSTCLLRPIFANMTSFIKPEVHNVLHRRQRTTEPRPSASCANWNNAFWIRAFGMSRCPLSRGKSGPALGGTEWRYGVPAHTISVPADSASEIVKFTISIPHESCTNAKVKYSSSIVPPDPLVHFYHCPCPHVCDPVKLRCLLLTHKKRQSNATQWEKNPKIAPSPGGDPGPT